MGKTATAKTNVVLVDAVRTPFGKAGSLYAQTRADDIMIRCIRGLLERNPNVPLDQIDDVAIAADWETSEWNAPCKFPLDANAAGTLYVTPPCDTANSASEVIAVIGGNWDIGKFGILFYKYIVL